MIRLEGGKYVSTYLIQKYDTLEEAQAKLARFIYYNETDQELNSQEARDEEISTEVMR